MHATSSTQFDAAGGHGVPGLELVRDGLYCYGLPQPGTLPHYAFSYLLLDSGGAVHVIDAGWDSDENWQRFTRVLSGLGRSEKDVATVTVTHLHPDHLGMAARIRAASGASVALHRAEQDGIRELAAPVVESEVEARLESWGVPTDRRPELLEAFRGRSGWTAFTADRLLDDGESLEIPGRSVRALHTPGHTTGHLAFVDDANELLFLGDLLLPNQFPGIGLGGTPVANPIDDYLASLATVAALDRFEALPGHGYRFTGIAARSEETAAHHGRRTEQVASAIAPGQTVWDLASVLTWTAGWQNLRGLALLSALSQTDLHLARIRDR
ncbi:glyoxylase-like metal-dependent hydrolase (beta-lactamase superfamily II) [Cryobacterium mesophilum]|uniref:MBL fold metallo-hydrolase n=1 Tax=Terrimesophilobacter mesophilus TaxID=433647 RepID=A0A4R8V8U4_9MICO|nr:MBL fold metallo-hydrolase [Terrimesophilobacter mesophilus]MBB5632766.1 glyoxylase-like metal-dependent hydrolase (beta-lactamase superfamily II) [Terrimesophilobacter mesophilus]TFB79561.1 MBL fold metallo-hydrolase [Terrimesophilobacter mesophilus]